MHNLPREVSDEQIRLLAHGISASIYDRNTGAAYRRAGVILGAETDQVERIAKEESDYYRDFWRSVK